MTKEEFVKLRESKQQMVYEWAVEKYGSWDNFKKACWNEGCIFEMPVSVIPPATYEEWMQAEVNGSKTDDLLEVENSIYRGFVLNNGHNRLKTYLHNNVERVNVKFIL